MASSRSDIHWRRPVTNRAVSAIAASGDQQR